MSTSHVTVYYQISPKELVWHKIHLRKVICASDTINLEIRLEVNIMVKVIQNESTHQIWDSYLRYAPETIILDFANLHKNC